MTSITHWTGNTVYITYLHSLLKPFYKSDYKQFVVFGLKKNYFSYFILNLYEASLTIQKYLFKSFLFWVTIVSTIILRITKRQDRHTYNCQIKKLKNIQIGRNRIVWIFLVTNYTRVMGICHSIFSYANIMASAIQ